ncbi:GNAT family N-acetyltransferase [Patiriisocius marinus]|uniref:GNAT family N-acetyltransferase n=1 Tax=Patiriisocius marinus TaxID=1397112 RepID=UPI00232F091B|nr:GNAT family N-acetyltransferase [Patiriisocius marinus]
MGDYILKTERLGLRLWKASDYFPFAEICADLEVMKHFPNVLKKEEAFSLITRFNLHYEKEGYTYFAVDILETKSNLPVFIGFTGIMKQTYESPFTPNVDIGWRLAINAWGNGYATEAAKACLDYAIKNLEIKTIISVASNINTPSINVMKKIGMHYSGEFNHPKLVESSNLNPCIVYSYNSPKKQ